MVLTRSSPVMIQRVIDLLLSESENHARQPYRTATRRSIETRRKLEQGPGHD
ncbi:hypothetical protein PAMC26510_01565 [Caballeronia sordidicola]|uniref:Uncharacterized protein n=1 Tax=Caballeronia sordidicola TaxID=196367 RepID=A0A242N997_CABSO|nr:hypothetical protein PAMC26510_01565 [Caballeronia sordidicola]